MRTASSALYAGPDLMDTAYRAAVRFSNQYHRSPPSGLLIMTGEPEFLGELVDWEENGQLFQKYRGIHLRDERVHRLFGEMREQDGAVLFGPDGELLGAELTIQGVTTREIGPAMHYVCQLFGDTKRTAHTRHSAAAYASLQHAPTITVSGTNGLVVAFDEGHVSKYYRPQTGEEGELVPV